MMSFSLSYASWEVNLPDDETEARKFLIESSSFGMIDGVFDS